MSNAGCQEFSSIRPSVVHIAWLRGTDTVNLVCSWRSRCSSPIA
jgi:hypothetical protein